MDIPAEIVALGTAGASTLVQSMATDAWNQVRQSFARLFARGHGDLARSEEKLERSRAELLRRGDEDLAEQMQTLTSEWSIRMRDLLEDAPQKAAELRRILAFCHETLGISQPQDFSVTQVAVAKGRSNVYQAGRDQTIRDRGDRR